MHSLVPFTARAHVACWLLAVVIPLPSWAQLSLADARQLALARQPLLLAERAARQSSLSLALEVRSLPAPKLRAGIINLPVTGSDALRADREDMTMRMLGIMQDFPHAEKRQLAAQRATIEGEMSARREDFTQRAIVRDVSLAWTELVFVHQARRLIDALDAEVQRQIEATLVAFRAGKMAQSEVFSAKIDRELLVDRGAELARQEALARADLARWIAGAADQPLSVQSLPAPTPTALETLLADLSAHPHLVTAERQIALARTDVEIARASALPDLSIELAYGYREASRADMLSVQIGIDLPFLQRERRQHLETGRLAQVTQAQAVHADNLTEMRTLIKRWHAEWRNNKTRAEHFEQHLLPQAQARIDATLAAYRAGKGELLTTLQARRQALDLRLQRLMLEADANRAAFQLEYYQREAAR